MLSGPNRGDAIYAQVSAQPDFKKLNAAEAAAVKSQLRAFFTADTAYLTGNAQVNPSSLANPSGQPVSVVPQTGLGSTSAPATITGLGTVS